MRDSNLSRLSNYKKINKLHLDYLVYYYLIRDIKYAINTYAQGNVLDIGCGNKPYEHAFTGKVSNYTGCDITQSDLNKVDIICEATNIPLPSESFNTIFSTQAIEHIENHQEMINEAFRLIKPGGSFILSGPMYWPLHEEPHDYFRFTKHGFEIILKKAGFEITETLSNGGMWATSGQALIHSHANSKSKFFPIRVLRFLFFRLRIYWIYNSFYKWLDKVDYNPINTMNYVIVAKKKK